MALDRRVPGGAFDSLEYRKVLGHFATGVVAVCAAQPDGTPSGMAVNSFTSVSLAPPLVAVNVANTSTTWPDIRSAKAFCASILAGAQAEVGARLARRGVDRFHGLGWRPAPTGSPIIDGALAWIDCTISQTIELGDHTMVIGQVVALAVERLEEPLLFFQGRFSALDGQPHTVTH